MRHKFLSVVTVGLVLCSCSSSPSTTSPTTSTSTRDVTPASSGTTSFRAEVWADNWFALYVNGEKVGEDHVPITTERSFNSETITFAATYPLSIALEVKDYTENDSGLEYIGTDRQQIGDGGVVAQITDIDAGRLVAVTDDTWKAYSVNTSPLNPECVTSIDPLADCLSRIVPVPAGWADSDFDDAGWSAATTFDASEVGPKDGYNDVAWDASARFIWGSDLKADNVVLLRHSAITASPKL